MKQPLLSIPLLADDGYKISLTANNIVVTKNNRTILKGIRDRLSTLWMIQIKDHKKAVLSAQDLSSVPVLHAANSAYHQPTIAKLMAFHNATIGSLPVKTLCNVIDNGWLTGFLL
jgi:phytoene dehydrogenase-like protein